MAKLPAGYVFNKRQLRILSPGKILYPFLSEHQACVCLFLKTNASLSLASIFYFWNGLGGGGTGAAEFGLILGGWYLSGALWYRGLSNLLRDSSPFSFTLFIFPTPPFFPPSPLSPVLKIHMAPTVYSEYTMPPPAALLYLLVHSALYLLP